LEKLTTKTEILPKAGLIKFSVTFQLKTLIRKSNHQHQDTAKSWKNQNFNCFLIRTLITKSNHQNQDIAKSWKKNKFSITF